MEIRCDFKAFQDSAVGVRGLFVIQELDVFLGRVDEFRVENDQGDWFGRFEAAPAVRQCLIRRTVRKMCPVEFND